MAAAVLSPGGLFVNKTFKRVLDINHFNVSLAHAHSSVLKATAQQHGIRPVGELAPCSGCSRAKGIRAPTPHRTTSGQRLHSTWSTSTPRGRSRKSLGGSRYVVMFVDSASRFQSPYVTREKSASAILGVIQRLWQTWEFLGRSGRMTVPSTPTRYSRSAVTVSKSATS